ncbi:hypothetical protein ANN_19654 [Periplaneta americana]|uniref:Histone-lysine N-methyltransferase, H3 lysine-79 specific n=1 Tax=Periplaneta americana TaxID=6978 RepID=A0ABQ8SBL5_PERAM|nr:hypothetical protein ANN_19654 [Periplaneta americana]
MKEYESLQEKRGEERRGEERRGEERRGEERRGEERREEKRREEKRREEKRREEKRREEKRREEKRREEKRREEKRREEKRREEKRRVHGVICYDLDNPVLDGLQHELCITTSAGIMLHQMTNILCSGVTAFVTLLLREVARHDSVIKDCKRLAVRLRYLTERSKRYERKGEIFLRRIITIDEPWARYYEPQLKRQSIGRKITVASSPFPKWKATPRKTRPPVLPMIGKVWSEAIMLSPAFKVWDGADLKSPTRFNKLV